MIHQAPHADVLHVVAAVLRDERGRILLAQRTADRQHAGLWEFPGGKCEPGEAPLGALVRELHEELGIDIDIARATPMIAVPFADGARRILLDVYRVAAFAGEPHGREGQALAWVEPARLVDHPMPPADRPVVAALLQPDRYLITPPDIADAAALDAALGRALATGIGRVQLRLRDLPPQVPEALAEVAMRRCAAHGAQLLLNSAMPGAASLAAALGCGLHLTEADLRACAARRGGAGGPARGFLPRCGRAALRRGAGLRLRRARASRHHALAPGRQRHRLVAFRGNPRGKRVARLCAGRTRAGRSCPGAPARCPGHRGDSRTVFVDVSGDRGRRNVGTLLAVAGGVSFAVSFGFSLFDLLRAPPTHASSADAGMMGGLAGLVLLLHVGFRLMVAALAAGAALVAVVLAGHRGRPGLAPLFAGTFALLAAVLPLLAAGVPDRDYLVAGLTWLVLPSVAGACAALVAWREAWSRVVGALANRPRSGWAASTGRTEVGRPVQGERMSSWVARARARLPILLLAFVAYAGVALLLMLASPVAAPWADPDLPFGTLLRVASQPWLNIGLRAGAAQGAALLVCAGGFALNLAVLTWLLSAWLSSGRR
jgi:mutator protein MutT